MQYTHKIRITHFAIFEFRHVKWFKHYYNFFFLWINHQFIHLFKIFDQGEQLRNLRMCKIRMEKDAPIDMLLC